MLNFRKKYIYPIAFTILSGCGGGGGGTSGGSAPVVSAPTPTPSPQRLSPSIASQPTTPVNSSLNNLTQTETFDTSAIFFQLGGGPENYVKGIDNTITFTVNADHSSSININNWGVSQSIPFTAAQSTISKQPEVGDINGTQINNGIVPPLMAVYFRSLFNDYKINIYKLPYSGIATSSSQNLDYARLGEWFDINSATGLPHSGLPTIQFIFGIRTPASAVPTSGTATYTASFAYYSYSDTVVSPASPNPHNYNNFADGHFDVNFNTGMVTGNFQTLETAKPGPNVTGANSRYLDFSMQIEANNSSFHGDVLAQTGEKLGSSYGGFYGPTAQELAGTFQFNQNGEHGVGYFGGRKQ